MKKSFLILSVWCLTALHALAQTVSITGPTSVYVGQSGTYYADFRNEYNQSITPPAGTYHWYAYDGTITSPSASSCTIQWSTSGSVQYEMETFDNYFYASLPVDVAALQPPGWSATTSVTTNSFTLNWFAATGASSYLLDVSASSGFTTGNIITGLSVTGTSKNVTGLSAGTPYYFRIKSVNSFTNSDYASASSVTLPSAPIANSASSVNSNSFTANWSSVTGATSYRLDVAQNSGFSPILGSYNGVTVNGTSQSVTGLSSGGTYYYRVRAVNSAGQQSTSSNIVTVVLPPDAPIASAATNVTISSFTANWGSISGGASYYELDVSTYVNFSSLITGQTLTVYATSYTITDLAPGYNYYYRVRAVTTIPSASSNVISIVTIPATPSVTSPTNFTTSSFTANWSSVSNATNYLLDVADNVNFSPKLVGYDQLSVTATSQSVTGLSPGKTYYYRVFAHNSSGNSSSSWTTALTIPSAPTANAATAITATSFTANWTSVQGAAGYLLDVSSNGFSSNLPAYSGLPVSGTSQSVTGLTAGTPYSFRVRAQNSSGPSSSSNSVSTITIPPSPVATAASSITSTSFTANWNAATGATSYLLYVATDVNFTSILPGYSGLSVSGTSQSVSGLAAATPYYYKVKATNGSGFSGDSNSISTVTVPAAPVAIAASGIGSTSFTANWNAATGATGYLLDVSSDGFLTFVVGYNGKPVTTTSQSVTGLLAGVTYAYRVRSQNASGNSVVSNSISATTIPPAPNATAASNFTATSFTANWNAAQGASGYQLDVSSSNNFSTFVTISATSTSQNVTGLYAGTTYYYRVRSSNSSGVSVSSNTITTLTVPAIPYPLPATEITSNSFKANWSSVQGATSYQLDVSTTNAFSTLLTGFSGLSVTGTNAVVTPLTLKGTYYYRVRAVNSSGGSANSAAILAVNLDQNYIRSVDVLVTGLTVESQVDAALIGDKAVKTDFFDGVGRPMQTVLQQQSPAHLDLVQPTVYDAFGRETVKYLPYVSGSDGWNKMDFIPKENANYTTASSPQYQFYQNTSKVATDVNPYSVSVVEPSLLNRVVKQGAAGAAWQPDATANYSSTDHTVKKGYELNLANEVLQWTYTQPTVSNPLGMVNASNNTTPIYYPANQLFKNRTKDEHGNETIEYIDKQGLTILKRVQVASGSPAINDSTYTSTYYVYNHYGKLVCVTPPEATKRITKTNSEFFGKTDALKNDFLKRWAFRYVYDGRKRMVQKQVPGADPVYMVYDRRDRLVMTQDGEERKANKWLYTKYDSMNRPVITGMYVHGSTIDQSAMAALISKKVFCETYNGATATHGYTNRVFPTSGTTVLTVNYYDNYNFVSDLALGSPYGFTSSDISGQEPANNARVVGQVTGAKTNVLGSATYLWSVTYFDSKYRTVQGITQNNKGGWDRATNVVDFTGRVMNTKTTHHTSTHADQVVAYRYTYDHASRRIKTFQALNNEPNEMLLSQNNYNELGQLVEKNLHLLYDAQDGQSGTLTSDNIVATSYNGEANLIARNSVKLEPNYVITASSTPYRVQVTGVTQAQAETNGRYFQSVDYRYNIRGWLTSMNNSQLANDQSTNDDTNDLFGMNLGYNTSIGTGNASLYNGNISAMKWSSNLALGATKDVAYNYSYDPLNRITAASYLSNTAGWVNPTGQFNESGYQYDLNGNIKNLIRKGSSGSTMDNLAYSYVGNQLQYVSDAGDATKGFTDGNTSGNDYAYDGNGNMTTDKNKNLTATNAISYNHLNLPTQVTKSTNEKIAYTYNAAGVKLMQQVYNASGAVIKTTDYDGPFIYQGDTLQFINHEEGRIVMKNVSAPEYQYHLKDHLGNVRVTFTTAPALDANKATYETANATAEQSKFLRYTNARRIYATILDHTNGSSPGYAERLSASSNEIYGLARSISVMPGDVVQAEVYAKYIDPNTANWTTALNTLMGQIAGNNASVVFDGAAYSSSTSSFPVGYSGLVTKTDDGAPKAYLNWLVFDRNYAFLTGGFKQITTICKESGADVAHEYLSSGNITITQPGYVYIYLSNESTSQVEVYFDDFKVTQTKSPVVQQEDFYPFGLKFNSFLRENSVPNTIKLFQGQEHIDDLGLNWDQFKWRNHQPEIGRFFNVDPLAEKYYYNSTYAFSENKVVVHREIEGLEAEWIGDLAQHVSQNPDGGVAKATGLLSGVGNVMGNTLNAIVHPLQTAEGLSNLMPGSIQGQAEAVANFGAATGQKIDQFQNGSTFEKYQVVGEVTASLVELAVGTKGMATMLKTAEISTAIKAVGLPNEANVVRGGTCLSTQFENGSGVTITNGKLSGVSVNSAAGMSVGDLAKGIPNGKIGATTVGEVRSLGGNVVSSPTKANANHATLSGITAKQAEQLFNPVVKNPNK